MAKIIISCILLCSFLLPTAAAYAKTSEKVTNPGKVSYDPEMNCTKKVKYTWKQRKHLEWVYQRIYRDYSDLIKAYESAGALTPEQTKIRYVMLHNYIKTFYKRNYQWCSEHESDEWEEEWYNNDND